MSDTTTPPAPQQVPQPVPTQEYLDWLWNELDEETQNRIRELLQLIDQYNVRLRITVGNLKGGVSKTTTAVMLALILGFGGRPVLLIDGDPTNQTCVGWAVGAGSQWPVNVNVQAWGEEEDSFAPRYRSMEGQFVHVVVDTVPSAGRLFRQAVALTKDLVIPVLPNPMDLDQLEETFDVALDIAATSQQPHTASVLLARAGKENPENSTRVRAARRRLDGDEKKKIPARPYLDTVIRELQDYALDYGYVPPTFGEYLDLAEELVEMAIAEAEDVDPDEAVS